MSVTERRRHELRHIVRKQIAYYLREDLDGGEMIMKEAWESCDGDEEYLIAKAELSGIIDTIETGPT